MPRLPNKNSQMGSEEPGALVFEHSREPKTFVIVATIVVFLVLVGGVYSGLRWHKKQLESEEKSLNEEIAELNKESQKPIVDEAISFRNRAEEAEQLLINHRHWNEVFSLLEDMTIPQVQYVEFKGDFSTKKIKLKLTTPSLKRISQKILVYRNVEEVEKFEFTPPEKSESGVNMEATLILSPQVWKKNN